MAKIALLGDSYVTRLEKFCLGDLKVPGDVRFFGVGGMKLENYAQALESVKLFHPDAVFINLGGNSISPKTEPSQLAEQLVNIVTELKVIGVKKVFLAEIKERGRFKPDKLDKKCFDAQRTKINKILRKRFGNDFIVFQDIKYPRDYAADLVHFNDRGTQKFFYSVRRVLFSFKNL